MLRLQSSRRLDPLRPTRIRRLPSPLYVQSMSYLSNKIKSGAVYGNHFGRGKREASFQTISCQFGFRTNIEVHDGSQAHRLILGLKNNLQDARAMLLIAVLSSNFFFRLVKVDFRHCLIKGAQHILSSGTATNLPLACTSTSLNKPVPLGLDVSFSSLRDVKWSFARVLYLFNMQLERDVATFLIALLAACFSFVLIGGFLFFKFRQISAGITQG